MQKIFRRRFRRFVAYLEYIAVRICDGARL